MTNSHIFSFPRFVFLHVLCVPLFLAAKSGSQIRNEHFQHQKDCQTCHQNNNKDLHLLTGKAVLQNEIPIMCGQCHGIVKRDWDQNIHGKKMDSWNSQNSRRISCIQCHDPHSPVFKKMQAEPVPQKPKLLIPKKHSKNNSREHGD